MKAVHFGAGNIGRGFIGNILHDSGYELLFVDMDKNLVQQIHNDREYEIQILDFDQDPIIIDNVDAILGNSTELVIEELVKADIITTSVGANNLKYLAQNMKNALLKRAELKTTVTVIANENTINATDILSEEIFNICSEAERDKILSITNFVNSAIDRQAMSKNYNGKSVALVEKYFEWVIVKNDYTKEIEGIIASAKFVEDLEPYIERKLFLVNAEHAAFAYLGKLFGYKTVQSSADNKDILNLVKRMTIENSRYFKTKYNMDPVELESFISKTLLRHTNPKFSDEVERVGRNPIRKLGPRDRLISPFVKLTELSLPNICLTKVIAAALFFTDESDSESLQLQAMIAKEGVETVLEKICGLSEVLITQIMKEYNSIKSDPNNIFRGVVNDY